MLKSKSFWLIALLVAAVIFAIGINRNKIYQSEIRLLILPKNQVTASNIDQITENAKEIPSSLTFYNKLVEANPAIEEGILNLSDKERRDVWNSKIKIDRVDKSGIIKVSAFDNDQSRAETISTQVANDLAIVIGKYYNTKTDLDIRTIDGPIDFQVPKANFANWIIASLLSGLVLSAFVFSLSQIFSGRKIQPEMETKKLFSLAGLKKYDLRKPVQSAEQVKKASAPANLPIVGEPMSSEIQEPQEAVSEEGKRSHREATPVEVKERLNSLLKGNL